MAKSKEYELAIKIAGEVERSFTESMGVTKKELNSIAKAAAKSTSGTEKTFQSGLTEVGGLFQSVGKTAGKVFKTITKAASAAGAGVTAGLGASVSVGAAFEKQMSSVGAISQASASDMEVLTETAKNLGATTQFTAEEVGEAMEYMAMAGWKAEDINSGIAGVMDLAAASGEDLGTVSDIVTDAMTAFGLSADQVGHFSDVLAQASANANTNVGMMGETFKYAAPVAGAMGYSVEDVALAVGLMANQGIKASQAGTSLRSIMTNLASPSETVADAMENLGLSLIDDEGRAKGFYEIMTDLRGSMSNMVKPTEEQMAALADLQAQLEAGSITDEEFAAQQEDMLAQIYGVEGSLKAASAAALAGKYGMAGLLAIVNSSDEDFAKLKESIDNCNGAAEQMAETKLDNLAGDVTIFKSAMDGLGIEVYDQVKDPMREAVQAGTDLISTVTQNIAGSGTIQDFIANMQEALPGVIQDVKDLGSGMADFMSPVLGLGGWLIENPEVIEGFLIGVGGAIATYKLITVVGSVASGFSKLSAVLTNPWAAAIVGVSGAIGLLVGVVAGVKAKNARDRAEELATHFGSMQLSLKDLKAAADAIVDNGSLSSLSEAVSAFEASEADIEAMNSAVETLNKANWKVSVGLELSEKDQAEYQSNIAEWVEACQKYVTDQAYGIHLAMSVVADGADTDSEQGQLAATAVKKIESFYQGKQEELAALGKELNEYVTQAFNDGLLDIDEAQHIQELQKQMADIQAALANSSYAASLERIGMGYSGVNLTPESFKNLQAEIGEAVNAAAESYGQAFEYDISAINVSLANGAITEEESEALKKEIKQNYLNNLGEIELQAQNFSLNTIMDAYGEELEAAMPGFTEKFNEAMANVVADPNNISNLIYQMEQLSDSTGLDSNIAKNISDLLEGMAPTTEELQNLADKYQEYGMDIPENISAGLKNAAALEAMAGDVEAIYLLATDELTNSEALQEMMNTCTEEGVAVPESFKKAIEDRQNAAAPAIDGVYQTTADYLRQVFANGFDVDTSVRVHAQSAVTVAPTAAAGTKWGGGHADGAIVTRPELAMIAEGGYPESVIPWDGSQNAFDLWMKTGQGIGALDKLSGGGIVGDLMDALDGGTTTNENVVITYSPNLNFYGGTPSQDDIVSAGRMSQQEFDKMMSQYLRNQHRLSFAGG